MKWSHTLAFIAAFLLFGGFVYALVPFKTATVTMPTATDMGKCPTGAQPTNCLDSVAEAPTWHYQDGGVANLASGGGGGSISGSIASTQVAYGSGADTISGSANLTWANTAGELSLDGTGPTVRGDGTLILEGDNGSAVNVSLDTPGASATVTADTINLSANAVLILDAVQCQLNGVAPEILSADADGASARGLVVNTQNTLSNGSARLLEVKNGGTVKAGFDTAGNLRFSTGGAGIANTGNTVSLGVGPSDVEFYSGSGSFKPTNDGANLLGAASQRWLAGLFGAAVAGQPACSSATRGATMTIFATGGNSDTFQVCMKAAADTYAWRTVYTAP